MDAVHIIILSLVLAKVGIVLGSKKYQASIFAGMLVRIAKKASFV
jgi:hypothetical protein